MASIQKLNPRHYRILDLCLRGWTVKQIASHLSMSPQQVSIVLNSPSFQHELALRRARFSELTDQSIARGDDEVTAAIRSFTLAAVKRLGLIVHSGRDSDALRASAEILDRGGYPKTQRTETKSLNINISPLDADRISETIRMEQLSSARGAEEPDDASSDSVGLSSCDAQPSAPFNSNDNSQLSNSEPRPPDELGPPSHDAAPTPGPVGRDKNPTPD